MADPKTRHWNRTGTLLYIHWLLFDVYVEKYLGEVQYMPPERSCFFDEKDILMKKYKVKKSEMYAWMNHFQ